METWNNKAHLLANTSHEVITAGAGVMVYGFTRSRVKDLFKGLESR